MNKLFSSSVATATVNPFTALEALQEITDICKEITLSQPSLEALYELSYLSSQFNQATTAPSIAMLEFVTIQKCDTVGLDSTKISSEGIIDTVKGWFTKTWDFLAGKIEKVQNTFKKSTYRNRIQGIRSFMNYVEDEVNQPGWQVNLTAYREIHQMLEHFITSAPDRSEVYMSYLGLHKELGKRIESIKDLNQAGLHDMLKIYNQYLTSAIDNIAQDIRLAELVYRYLTRLAKPQHHSTANNLAKINSLFEEAYRLRFTDGKVNHMEFRDIMADVVRVGSDTENKLTDAIVKNGLKQIEIQHQKDEKFKQIMAEIEDMVSKMSTSMMMSRS